MAEPMGTGVAVRGLWTIEVRDPDGTVVERREFQNEYFDGNNVLAQLLTREKTTGGWMVSVGGAVDSPCEEPTANEAACKIVEPDHPIQASPAISYNLDVAAGTQSVELTGSVVANGGGEIRAVFVFLGYCDPTVAPSDCLASASHSHSTSYQLTSHQPDPFITVLNGQQVLVTVSIQFSSGG
jgi:hypothetical protein